MARYNTCKHCRFEVPIEFRFCGNCGKPITNYADTSRQGIALERRNMILMFCDLVGSTSLAERLDPEDMLKVINNYQASCADIVNSYGGHIAQYLGDGILIYFGYPHSQEDDPSRAVRCALGIQENMLYNGGIEETRVQARIALHSGRVVVGPLAGQAHGQALAIGEAPNLAARLQKLAAPGEVVVSESLWRLLPPEIIAEARGTHQLKGVNKPIAVYRICGINTKVSTSARQFKCFVGRERELLQIVERWRDAITGRPQMLLLRGEPGIGKSSLIDVIKEQLGKEPTILLSMTCNLLAKDTAFLPVIELIRSRLELNDLSSEQQLDKLHQFLGQIGLAPENNLPLLAQLVQNNKIAQYCTSPSLSPQVLRQRIMELLLELLRHLSATSPILLLIEDLHWCDASTLDLLRQYLSDFDREPMLLIASARPEFNPGWLTAVNLYRIELDALPVLAASHLIYSIAGGSDWPIELVRVIRQRAGGNPLFLEEITRSVIDALLANTEKDLALANKRLMVQVVPASTESAIMARLDRLGSTKKLVQLGAIIGRKFSLSLLTAITKLDTQEIVSGLENALSVDLLRKREAQDAEYFFKHALVQDVAYNSLLISERVYCHSLIADAILADFAGFAVERPEVLAHHLSGASRHQEASWQWLAAGKASASRGAAVEALYQLQRGLADLAAVPADQSQQEHELSLLKEILPVKMLVYGWAAPQISDTCCRALEILQSLGRQADSYPYLWGLWSNRFVGGQLNQAEKTAIKLTEMAESADMPPLAITSQHAVSYTALYRGELAKAFQGANKIVQEFDLNNEIEIINTFQLSSAVCMQKVVATCLWMQGNQQEAISRAMAMVSFSKGLNHGASYACALAFMLHFKAYTCDWQGIIKTADQLSKVALGECFDLWAALASMYRKAALSYLNPGGLDKFLDHRKSFQHTQAYCVEGTTAMFTTDLLVRHGRHEEALAWNLESEELMLQWQIGLMLPDLYRVRGHALWKLRQLDEAEAAYGKAVECAKGQGAWSLVLRALKALRLFIQVEQRAPLAPPLAELWTLANQRVRRDGDLCNPQLVTGVAGE